MQRSRIYLNPRRLFRALSGNLVHYLFREADDVLPLGLLHEVKSLHGEDNVGGKDSGLFAHLGHYTAGGGVFQTTGGKAARGNACASVSESTANNTQTCSDAGGQLSMTGTTYTYFR